MKYKMLLNGKNQNAIKDFFLHTSSFDCLTTSGLWEDICAHMNIFRPDGYICFTEQLDDALISQLRLLRSKMITEAAIIIVCASADVDDYKKKTIDLQTFVTPKSSPQLTERAIKKYFADTHRDLPAQDAEEEKTNDLGIGISLEDLKQSFSAMQKKHILVVDDDRTVLKMLKTALSDEYDVTTMVNGKMAEKFLATKNADIILLDYEMPEESGPEVFRRLKENGKAKTIPVVFLTGVAESRKIKDVLALKPQGYLLKPIDMERLRSTLKDLLK